MSHKSDKTIYMPFHGRFPGEKAASLWVAKLASAMAIQGAKVCVIAPKRKHLQAESPFQYYGVPENFEVVYVPTVDLFNTPFKRGAFYLSFLIFSITSYRYLKKHAKKKDIIFTNETLPAFLAAGSFPLTCFEIHVTPKKKAWFYRNLIKRVPYFVGINEWKRKILREEYGVDGSRILIEPSGVGISDFDIQTTKEEARRKLELPQDKNIVLYTGHLYKWKGVRVLKDVAKKFTEDTLFVFVGGTPEYVENFKNMTRGIENIEVKGHQPHETIPCWQKASDVLVIPNTAKDPLSTHDTSPMKLYEYMASKRNIVASDIPSIREVVDEKSAILVAPDDPEALFEGIQTALATVDGSRVENAYQKVLKHTWEKRAERILTFLESKNV